MTKEDFGFHFEKTGLGGYRGPTSPEEEHFKDMTLAESIVRELGQNSLDAKDPEDAGPVRMTFDLRKWNTVDIPGFEDLKTHIQAADEFTRDIDEANDRLRIAAEAAEADHLYVLKVSDFGTIGLNGNEDDKSSPLIALTHGVGISSGKAGKGGSFGVGAATGVLASSVLTVFWTTLTKERPDDEVVFAGLSQLSTHSIDGTLYNPDGFYIDRGSKDRLRYRRSNSPIGPIEIRREPGTDTYILGYLDAKRDPDLIEIKKAFVKNFLFAIDRGKLIVEGTTDTTQWILNSETLREEVKESSQMRYYYEAIQTEPYIEQNDRLGELKLYMYFDENIREKLNTITMRSPLMKVTKYRHNIRANYAAVFVCEDEPGNSLLRSLEPPSHDTWEVNRKPHGKKTVDTVKQFIGRGLRSRVDEQIGETIDIKGLNKLLPISLGNTSLEEISEQGKPNPNGEGKNVESSTHQGDPSETNLRPRKKKNFTVKARVPATAGGDEDGMGGQRSGKKKSKTTGGNKRVRATEGDGTARIEKNEIDSRFWFDEESGDLIAVLRSSEPSFSDITLAAFNEKNLPEADYQIPIRAVQLRTTEGLTPIEFRYNTILNVPLMPEDGPTTLLISLSERRRFRVGVV